jgi:hypothetical protein
MPGKIGSSFCACMAAQFQHARQDEGILTHPSRWKNRTFFGSPDFIA